MQTVPVPIVMAPEWELRKDQMMHGRMGRTQNIYINIGELRRRVKQDGYTFTDTGDYLRKYHGMKNFELLELSRIGTELTVLIRRIGVVERLRNWMRSL